MFNVFQSIGLGSSRSGYDNSSSSPSRKPMRQKRSSRPTLPLYYAPLAQDGKSGCGSSSSSSSNGSRGSRAPIDTTTSMGDFMTDDNESQDSIPLTSPLGIRRERREQRRREQQRRNTVAKAAAMAPPPCRSHFLPSSRRFWADFTLGFSDGLTVPFALTAGLSSLGETDTVLYAGLAEISAGCISMGIGGYLSAKPTGTAASAQDDNDDDGDEEEKENGYMDDTSNSSDEEAALDHTGLAQTSSSSSLSSPSFIVEKRGQKQQLQKHASATTNPIDCYLAPLSLPADLQRLVLAHINTHPLVADAVVDATAAADSSYCGGKDWNALSSTEDDEDIDSDEDDEDNEERVWPVAAGLSVALGYLIGGLLPLGPYFFVANVGDGLRWSFAVCVLALFCFGFLRDFVLSDDSKEQKTSARLLSWHKQRIPWNRVWNSTYEGVQMVILGGIAAIAAVICVRWFEGASSGSSSSSSTVS